MRLLFHLKQVSAAPLINVLGLSYVIPYIKSEKRKGENYLQFTPGELHPASECICPPVSLGIEMSHGSDTFWLKEISYISCSSRIQPMNSVR